MYCSSTLLDEKHIQYLYLPPYSPDYNPIENMWSKIKANMRKQKVRAADLLPEAIEKAFSSIHISDCIGWVSCVWICAIIYWIAIIAVRLSVSAHIVFQSHLATYNRNDYESVWYYKRLQYTRRSDDMPADNHVF